MRPRFSQFVPYERDEVVERLRARQVCTGCPCKLTVLDRHVEVSIREDLRHFWSPVLSLEIDPHAEGSELHGLFGPNANVWTSFVAAYGFVGCSTFFAAMLGASQQLAGQTPWGLIALPVGSALAAGVYAGSLVGQRLAAEQMAQLACFLRASLGVRTTAEEPLPCRRLEP